MGGSLLDENTMEFYLVDIEEKDKINNLNNLLDIELFKEKAIEFIDYGSCNIPKITIKDFIGANPNYANLCLISYPQLDEGYSKIDEMDRIKDLVEIIGIEGFSQLLDEMENDIEVALPDEVIELVNDENNVIDVIEQKLELETTEFVPSLS